MTIDICKEFANSGDADWAPDRPFGHACRDQRTRPNHVANLLTNHHLWRQSSANGNWAFTGRHRLIMDHTFSLRCTDARKREKAFSSWFYITNIIKTLHCRLALCIIVIFTAYMYLLVINAHRSKNINQSSKSSSLKRKVCILRCCWFNKITTYVPSINIWILPSVYKKI